MAQMTRKQHAHIVQTISDLEARLVVANKNKADAAAHGDFRENSEFDQAKEEIRILEDSLETYRGKLRDAEVVEGSSKRVKFLFDKEVKTMSIEQDGSIDYENTISEDSPFGVALQGKQVGDKFEYTDNVGVVHLVEVLLIM